MEAPQCFCPIWIWAVILTTSLPLFLESITVKMIPLSVPPNGNKYLSPLSHVLVLLALTCGFSMFGYRVTSLISSTTNQTKSMISVMLNERYYIHYKAISFLRNPIDVSARRNVNNTPRISYGCKVIRSKGRILNSSGTRATCALATWHTDPLRLSLCLKNWGGRTLGLGSPASQVLKLKAYTVMPGRTHLPNKK